MLKFSVILPEKKLADQLEVFLENEQLDRWTIEKNNISGKYRLCGYVDSLEIGNKDFSRIVSEFKDLPKAKILKIKKDGWEVAYRNSAKPWRCENLRWIPLWMKDQVQLNENDIPVYIEPGMAFGTGTHETTQMCAHTLVMFQNLYKKTDDLVIKNCIDAGCGSGILGISAIKLGLSHATMIDIDPDAVRIARENAILNEVYPDQIDFVVGDLRTNLLGRQTDLLMANILANVLVDNADLLVNSVNAGGLLCLSGILASEADDVKEVFVKLVNNRWSSNMCTSSINGEWASISFFRG